MHCQLGRVERAVKRTGGIGKRCQNVRQDVNYLSERQEIFRGMVEDKITLQTTSRFV